MIKIAPGRVERAFRDAWRASFLKDVKASAWIVALLIAGFGLIAFFQPHEYETVGVVEAQPLGIHQAQVEGIPPGMSVRFALENGEQGVITLPRGELYHADMLLELDVLESRGTRGGRFYRFRRYVPPHES